MPVRTRVTFLEMIEQTSRELARSTALCRMRVLAPLRSAQASHSVTKDIFFKLSDRDQPVVPRCT